MNEAPDDEREPARYIRLPWPVVGAGLFVLLALVLGLGLFANRNLRPQVGVVPTPSPVAVATPTVLPVAAAAVVQASTPTVAPTSVPVTATAPPAAATATVAPSQAAPAAAEGTPTELPTVEPALADEVGKAYVTFWRVRSQAVLELDSSHLPEVMAGDYLQNFESHLDGLRMQSRAIKTQVTLNYNVVKVSSEVAIVHDRIEDGSFYIDPGTQKPLTDPANDQVMIEFSMAKFDGVWKVTDSVTAE